MTIRVALTDFALKNPFYAGATCTVYQVDPTTLARLPTFATLYASPTGGTLRANPMTLDSDGKFPTPLYVDQPVIIMVEPVAGAVEELGVQGLAPSRWRGVYTVGTVYYPGERFRSPSSAATYIVLRGFTSTSFLSDLINPAPLFEQELDADSLLDGVSMSLFGTLLPNTPALGYYRINAAADGIEARTPAQVRSDIGALSTSGGTISGGDLTVTRTGADPSIYLNSGDVRARRLYYQTGGVNRISLGVGGAESGSNTGSDFALVTWDDAGSTIGTAINVNRATRQVSVPSGTAASPSVAFIGDTDNGFFRPTGDQFGIATGGVVRLTLANTVASLATPLLLPASDPTDASHAARKAYVDAGDRWVTIADAAVTSVTQVEITWAADTYRAVRVFIIGVQPATGGATVNLTAQMRQGASTWLSGGTDIYNQGPYWSAGSGAVQNFQASVAILTAGGHSTTPEPANGTIDLDPGATGRRGGLVSNLRWLANGGHRSVGCISAQVLPSSAGISGLRFGWEGGGNFAASGRIVALGLKA